MDQVILDDISFDVDEKGLLELLRLQTGTTRASVFLKILDEARSIAAPKAVFTVAAAHIIDEDNVEIGEINFTSRVLRVNLQDVGVVYPFVATCGVGLDEWSNSLSGTLQRFWADSIMLMALGCAVAGLESYLKERIGEGPRFSTMNPGSLADWPLQAQAALFSLLGEAPASIGVRLTERMVIRPLKSVSGIHFASEEGFVNCSLCPRQDCPSRRAQYDPSLYATRYRQPV